MFRNSWDKIEKCLKLSVRANIIFLKEVAVASPLEPCCSMRPKNSLALGINKVPEA